MTSVHKRARRQARRALTQKAEANMTTPTTTAPAEPDTYMTADESGDGWRLMLGDSCERLAEFPDESVDLSVCSPPFAQLYNYSPSPRDLSNSHDRDSFFEHYAFVIREQFRLTKPGRIAAIHVQQITMQKVLHGVIGLTDFRGQVIAAFQAAGWIFHGEVTIDKDPQAQAIRTKAQSLLFVTKERDSSMLRPALADYLLLFRKPGDNAVPIQGDVSNEEWISWARPVWLDIHETNTLNVRVAKDDADERHICPLQLDFIERVVRLWSNLGDTVLTPFAGIGSEVYVARRLNRFGLGCELKPSYWRTGVDNLKQLEFELSRGQPVRRGRVVIDGKALWAPDFGEPCDCIQHEDYEEDCPHVEPVDLLRLDAPDGTAWVTTPWHAAVQLRKDQVEIVGEWAEWTDFNIDLGRRMLPRLLAAQPLPIRSTALFRRENLEPLLADGCRVLPTDQNLSAGSGTFIHAVMRGEDRIGWICPADPTRGGVVAGETYMRIPRPNDTTGVRA